MFFTANVPAFPRSIPDLEIWFDVGGGYLRNSGGTPGSGVFDRAISGRVLSAVGNAISARLFSQGTMYGITCNATAITFSTDVTLTATATLWCCAIIGSNEDMSIFANSTNNGRLRQSAGGNLTLTDGTTTVTGASTIPTGRVLTLAGVYNGTNGFVYLNGVQDGSNTGMNSAGIAVQRFSNATTTGDRITPEFAIWNRALEPQEILMLHRYAMHRWQ